VGELKRRWKEEEKQLKSRRKEGVVGGCLKSGSEYTSSVLKQAHGTGNYLPVAWADKPLYWYFWRHQLGGPQFINRFHLTHTLQI
jgi:hypothetical protein